MSNYIYIFRFHFRLYICSSIGDITVGAIYTTMGVRQAVALLIRVSLSRECVSCRFVISTVRTASSFTRYQVLCRIHPHCANLFTTLHPHWCPVWNSLSSLRTSLLNRRWRSRWADIRHILQIALFGSVRFFTLIRHCRSSIR